MNLKILRLVCTVLLVSVCVAGAAAQEEQVSGKKRQEVKEVNVGWASFEVELRDIVTDQLVAGNVDFVGELADNHMVSNSRFVVMEVNAEGYIGGREHLFVVSPERKGKYQFVIYVNRPMEPANVQHVATID